MPLLNPNNPGWMPLGTFRGILALLIVAVFLAACLIVIFQQPDKAFEVLAILSGFASTATVFYFKQRETQKANEA